jgi:hypothetical protein
MNANHVNVLMQAVLDGSATPQQARELDDVLAADAEARLEFESWRQLFKALAGQPVAHPPEGLVAAISAALPSRTGSTRKSDQLFFGSSVLGRGQQNVGGSSSGFRATLRRVVRSEPTQELGQMNVNRKVWGGAAFALLALGTAAVVFDYPPRTRDLLGTIVPAERYRAPQSGADAIKLGDQSIAQLMQTDGFDRMVKDPELQAMARNQSMQVLAKFLIRHADASRLFVLHSEATNATIRNVELAKVIAENVDAARLVAKTFDANQSNQAQAVLAATTQAQRLKMDELSRVMSAQPQASLAILSNVDAARVALSNLEVARAVADNVDASRILLSTHTANRVLNRVEANAMIQSAERSVRTMDAVLR